MDQAYDGGKPVWGKPAIVYASGSVVSIGVLVFGIRKCVNFKNLFRDIFSRKLIDFKVEKQQESNNKPKLEEDGWGWGRLKLLRTTDLYKLAKIRLLSGSILLSDLSGASRQQIL